MEKYMENIYFCGFAYCVVRGSNGGVGKLKQTAWEGIEERGTCIGYSYHCSPLGE